MSRPITTYAMSPDNERLGFAIRDQSRVTRTEAPHRHEFYQMRLDLSGYAHHTIGARQRALGRGSVTFVLPYCMHRGGRGRGSRFYVVNFHHRFLRPEGALDPLCLDGLPLDRVPELAPFVFQDELEFRVEGEDLSPR